MTVKVRTYISIAMLAVVAIVVFVFSNECIWAGDDISYHYICSYDGPFDPDRAEIESLTDVFESQVVHYFTVNGRFVAHCLVQLYCGILGKTVFAVSNAIVYVVFVMLIIRLLNIKLNELNKVISVVLLVLFAFDTKYVPSCQIGFVWMFVLALIWLYIFSRVRRCGLLQCVVLFVFSCIVGNGQEALTIGIVGAVVIDALRDYKGYGRAKWSMITGLIVGLLVLSFAPSTINRINYTEVSFLSTIMSFVKYGWISVIFVAVLIYYLLVKRLPISLLYRENRFWIHVWIILFAMNLCIGIYCNRQLFGMDLAAIFIMLNVLNGKLSRWIIGGLALFIVLFYHDKMQVIEFNSKQYEQVVAAYNNSESGVFYLDLGCKIHTCSPSPYIACPYPMDLNMVLYKLTKDSKTHKQAQMYPVCMKELEEPIQNDSAIEFVEGCYVLILSKNSNAQILLKRQLDIGFIKLPMADEYIGRANDNRTFVKGDSYILKIIYQDQPFIKYKSVEIIE